MPLVATLARTSDRGGDRQTGEAHVARCSLWTVHHVAVRTRLARNRAFFSWLLHVFRSHYRRVRPRPVSENAAQQVGEAQRARAPGRTPARISIASAAGTSRAAATVAGCPRNHRRRPSLASTATAPPRALKPLMTSTASRGRGCPDGLSRRRDVDRLAQLHRGGEVGGRARVDREVHLSQPIREASGGRDPFNGCAEPVRKSPGGGGGELGADAKLRVANSYGTSTGGSTWSSPVMIAHVPMNNTSDVERRRSTPR